MKIRFLLALFILISTFATAQKATVKGVLREADTRTPMVGASVTELGTLNRVITDQEGAFTIQVAAGNTSLIYYFTGYKADTVQYMLSSGQTKVDNKALKYSDMELNTIVVSSGKASKRIQNESVTIEVYKPRVIENNNITNVIQAIAKVPGVTIAVNSISIRGGSGYSYGSGSRVTMVIDDMPLLTPDRGEIKWEFVPLENLAQVEVLKGASSVQFGSSALNGIIQVSTANPTDKPQTSFSTYMEIYDRPKVKSYQWWNYGKDNFNSTPYTVGMTFNHREKTKGGFEWQLGGNAHQQNSYLQSEFDHRARISTKLRFLPKKLNNRLILGLSGYALFRKSAFQFFWKDGANPYISADGVVIRENYFYTAIDPSITYMDKKSNQIKLLTRYYFQKSLGDRQGRPLFHQFYADLQYRHDFGKLAKVIAGINNNSSIVQDNTLGIHKGNQGGIYLQGDVNWRGLTVNLGIRSEYINLDSITKFTLPVTRFGINYQFKKYNYIRFGFGQGFRYGSIAERFVDYQLGYIFIKPNFDLKPESGYTGEIGYKRSFNIGKKWRGYADAAIFYNEFKQMIEFNLDSVAFDANSGLQAFFKSKNITRARILGWEFALVGEGQIGPVDLSFQGGYTYFYPLDLSSPNASNNIGWMIKQTFANFVKTDSASRIPMLKYRNRHTFKFDLDALVYKHYRIGTSVMYYSYMDGIDPVFDIAIPDLANVRKARYGKGDWVWDMRFGYDLNTHISFNFLVKNILNADYALRVAKPNPPRSFTLQVNFRF